MTKIQRSGILKSNRLIYVSWHVGEERPRPWVDHFCEKAHIPSKDAGCHLGRTDGGLAGDPHKDTIPDVTDMVAVLTDKYLIANQTQAGELARFIELVADPIADEGSKRAWLAPLQSCTYRHFRFGDVSLADNAGWLIRRKRDGDVYPPSSEERGDREIWELVRDIIAAIEKDDGSAPPKTPSVWGSVRRLLTGANHEGG